MTNKSLAMNNGSFIEWIKKQNAGLWFGILFLAFSILFFVMSFGLAYETKYGAGPGMYPRWLSGISIVIAIIYIWHSCTKNVFTFGKSFPGKSELINVLTIFLSTIVFILLLDKVGFCIAGSLLMFVVFIRNYKLWKAILLSVVITYICFYVFKVFFSVPLPVNMFGF